MNLDHDSAEETGFLLPEKTTIKDGEVIDPNANEEPKEPWCTEDNPEIWTGDVSDLND